MTGIKASIVSRWNTRSLVVAAAATGILASLAVPAHAQERIVGEFGWLGVGKTYEIDKGHFYWVGEFSGTFFNEKGDGSPLHKIGFKCPGFNDLDFTNKRTSAGGYCIGTDLEGDRLYLTWRIPSGNPAFGSRNAGTVEYNGGTGKYKDWTGKFPFLGTNQVNWADGTATGYASWIR
jgi:hypothetical protein